MSIKVAVPPGWKAPRVGGPTQHQAAVVLELEQMRAAVGDMTRMLARLVPEVLSQETVILDANGQATKQFRVPFRAISVDNFGQGNLTVAADTLKGAAPNLGPGVARVGPGGYAVINTTGYAWTIYGGTAGDAVTVATYACPQPPIGVAGSTAGQLVTGGSGGLIVAAFGQASLNAYGAVTGPTAAQAIATINAAPAGLYDVLMYVGCGGTTAAVDANNMQLVIGTGTPIQLTNNSTSGSAAESQALGPIRVRVPAGGANIVVQAGPATPTGTAAYRAQIIATQVGS